MLGPVPAPDELPDLASAVLDLVDEVPRGRVVTYGDLAAVVGCGPRQVGTVLARWGGAVAWWRVLRADGSPAPGLEREALSRYRAEGTALRPGGAAGRPDRRAVAAGRPAGIPRTRRTRLVCRRRVMDSSA